MSRMPWSESRRQALLWLTLPAVAGGLALSPVEEGPTLCPFALVTGAACPGCGMTRAVSSLLRGDLSLALDYHPLAPMVVALAVAAWSWALLRRRQSMGPLPAMVTSIVLLVTAGLLVAVWGYRFAAGSLPPV